jgi:hypothetical protein
MSVLYSVIFFYMCFSNIEMPFYRESNLSLDQKARSLFDRIQPVLAAELFLNHLVLSRYLDIVAYLAWVVSLWIHTVVKCTVQRVLKRNY